MFGRQKNAYWIQKTHLFRQDEYACSACGQCFDKPYVICPHCGRNMGKAKYDPSWVDEAEIMDIPG